MADTRTGTQKGRTPGTIKYGEQAQTLGQDPRHMFPREYLELTSYPLFHYRMMNNLANNPEGKRQWYIKKLGKYDNQLDESATNNRIPVRLLANIILNELADIDPRDWLQQQFISHLRSGSLGIAQIEVSTVLKHNLLRGFLVTPNANTAAMLLGVAQYSIEACAREIRYLLTTMEAHPEIAWAARFKFVPPPAEDPDPARYYRPGVITVTGTESDADREAFFANFVGGAYNGGDVLLRSGHPENFKNCITNGQTAEIIARDLFRFDLFGE
jgi:hypothetical protein